MLQNRRLGVRALSDDEAAAAAAATPALSWRQAPAYAREAAADVGAQTEFVTAGAAGFAAVRIKRLPVGPWGVAYVADGPSGLSGDAERLADALDSLEAEFVAGRRLTLRVQPQFDPEADVAALAALFEGRGYRPLEAAPYRTIVLDLDKGEAALRAGFHGKWRGHLSRGERSGLEIVRSEDPADFARFAPLLGELAEKKGFKPAHDADFFARVAARRTAGDRIVLHLAVQDGQVVGGHVGAYTGRTAVYLLGAANAAGRERQAAYVLQWAAIRYALSLGLRWYDTGGVDEAANPDVFHFKSRMGGALLEWPAGWELAPDALSGLVVRLAETVYRRVKGGRKA